MRKLSMTIVAFILVTFGVQGMSHFAINVEHFAAIEFMRPKPIMVLGFTVMIIQALIIGVVMLRLYPDGATLKQAISVSASFGIFLGSYIALTEPAKYAAPSIPAWIIVEGTASFIQFALFGVLLSLIYRKSTASTATLGDAAV